MNKYKVNHERLRKDSFPCKLRQERLMDYTSTCTVDKFCGLRASRIDPAPDLLAHGNDIKGTDWSASLGQSCLGVPSILETEGRERRWSVWKRFRGKSLRSVEEWPFVMTAWKHRR